MNALTTRAELNKALGADSVNLHIHSLTPAQDIAVENGRATGACPSASTAAGTETRSGQP